MFTAFTGNSPSSDFRKEDVQDMKRRFIVSAMQGMAVTPSIGVSLSGEKRRDRQDGKEENTGR